MTSAERAASVVACAALLSALSALGAAAQTPVSAGGAGAGAEPPLGPSVRSGEALYEAACATCHGIDGRGRARSHVGFDVPLPDFTDCSFATREPDQDWLAVTHDGGPARAFDRRMAAFEGAMTKAEMRRVLGHVRGFCEDDAWPRGELNLPRPLVTEKAFPEDEAVVTVGVTTESPVAINGELVYEQRVGARHQIEVLVPFGVLEQPEPMDPTVEQDDWNGGLGDIAFGLKSTLAHSLRTGSILSLGGEVFFPTGDEAAGLSKGTFVFEPFFAYGQIIPVLGFLHLQGGAEIAAETSQAEHEAFGRAAYGRTFTIGRFGRTVTPMVEALGKAPIEGDSDIEWDVVPQMQITLSTRQHVRLDVGARIPVSQTDQRAIEVMTYLLWDWFDGGLFEGW